MLYNAQIDDCITQFWYHRMLLFQYWTTRYTVRYTGVVYWRQQVYTYGSFATNYLFSVAFVLLLSHWRWSFDYWCLCIAGVVSSKKSVTSAFPRTKSNTQGECRMSNLLDLVMQWLRQVEHYMWGCSCQTCLWHQPHPREHIRDWFGMTLVLMFVYALQVELWQRKVSVSSAPPRGRSRTLKVSAECQIVGLFNAIVVDTQCSVRL